MKFKLIKFKIDKFSCIICFLAILVIASYMSKNSYEGLTSENNPTSTKPVIPAGGASKTSADKVPVNISDYSTNTNPASTNPASTNPVSANQVSDLNIYNGLNSVTNPSNSLPSRTINLQGNALNQNMNNVGNVGNIGNVGNTGNAGNTNNTKYPQCPSPSTMSSLCTMS